MLGYYDMLIYGAAFTSLVMIGLWFVQRKTGDAGIVDVGWAGMIGVLTVAFALLAPGYFPRRLIVGVLGATWAFRLAFHLLVDRILKAEEEDGRYQMLREKWGDNAQRNMFWFYQAQAVFAVLFVLPISMVTQNAKPLLTVWDFAGIAVWVIAVTGESIADRQLARWRRNPDNKGKTCRAGLWGYSRHPNYFFEWIHWWAYVLLCVGTPYVWGALAGPAVMLFLLFRVTGIPYTEKRALASRGDDYRRYQEETSAFIPWFKSQKGAEPISSLHSNTE